MKKLSPNARHARNDRRQKRRHRHQLRRMHADFKQAHRADAARAVAFDLNKAGSPVTWKGQGLPKLPASLDLPSIARTRVWLVHNAAQKLERRSQRAREGGKQRYNVACTVVTSLGMIPLGQDWNDLLKSRQRWCRRRFAKMPGSPLMIGFVDVSLNRNLDGTWCWSAHEHIVVNLRAENAQLAVRAVRETFRPLPRESGIIPRPIHAVLADHPAGYLAYASRTLLPFNVLTREEYVKRDGTLGKSHRRLRGKQRAELITNLAKARLTDRILLGGLRRDGKGLRSTRLPLSLAKETKQRSSSARVN